MNNDKIEIIYSKQEFLNPVLSPSTGSVSAFIGKFKDEKDPLAMWLRISDCHNSISLHKCDWDYTEEFLNKMKKLHGFIGDFIENIEKFKNGDI